MAAQLSRRYMLRIMSNVGTVGGITALASVPNRTSALDAPSSSQLRKQDVQYQDQPKGSQRCEICKNFVNPSGCQVVAGSVGANGWCLLFRAKTA